MKNITLQFVGHSVKDDAFNKPLRRPDKTLLTVFRSALVYKNYDNGGDIFSLGDTELPLKETDYNTLETLRVQFQVLEAKDYKKY